MNPNKIKIIVREDYVAPKRDPIERLNSFLDIEEGWNGGEGLPISEEALNIAISIIKQAEADRIPGPYIHAKPEGGILLEWTSDLNYFIIDVSREGEIYIHEDTLRKA